MFFKKRFFPLFGTQFLGALNDSILKNAIVILITYKIAGLTDANRVLLVTAAGGIFILPFFLFSALAGQIADIRERSKLTQWIKIFEIIIMAIASFGFFIHNLPILLVSLFLMGTHSTFFGPIKYSLLPQHLPDHELIQGNGFVEMGTFLAILIGTILGAFLISQESGALMISSVMFLVAIAGYIFSRNIPLAPTTNIGLEIEKNIFKSTFKILFEMKKNRTLFLCILGISWFWFFGATLLAQFPTLVKDGFNGESQIVTLFLFIFSVGVGIGSMLCNKLLRGQIQSTFVPISAILLSFFCWDLSGLSRELISNVVHTQLTLNDFLHLYLGWRILVDLLFLSVVAGVYIVPLYAIMQHSSPANQTARVIAANNIMNAIFMVVSAIIISILFSCTHSFPSIFTFLGWTNFVVGIYICKLLPDSAVRSIFRAIFFVLYRVKIKGLENYNQAGKRVLLVANHVSFLDAALVAAYLPEKITFAVNTHIARKWWFKPFLSVVDAYPLDPTNPLSIKKLIEILRTDRKVMIFPEGRITVTGSLMKIYEGTGMIADKTQAVILPIHIEGAQLTPFSRLKGKFQIRWFPQIKLTILPSRKITVAPEITGRKRRYQSGLMLYDVMSNMIYESKDYKKTLFSALMDASELYGPNHLVVEDIAREPLSYRKFIAKAFGLGRVFHRYFPKDKSLGVMLPNSVATSLTFFGLHAFGKYPAMINYSQGSTSIHQSCVAAGITNILTSRRFIEIGKFDSLIQDLQSKNIRIVYLEDLRSSVNVMDKLIGLMAESFPKLVYWLCCKNKNPNDPAVVLFTSGSEGTPKGVVLSHSNIQSNRLQMASRIDFGPQDIVFNCLPMFHSFGLTGGTLLPILSGLKTFYYPSPLHYRIVPELVYDTNATLLFGTDTFLSGYAKYAHPYDFYSLRYAFAGAEKLKDETRSIYAEKFGVRIFEGYGATETSPVLSINTPMQNRKGTVGRFVPYIEHKVEKVEGIDNGGQLWVRGPNIMTGYLKNSNPGVIETPQDGWYDTGDIVNIDIEGFIEIKGRTKRFAKIGGEMISLSSIEMTVAKHWPKFAHAIVSVPHEKKGEAIVLLTTNPDLQKEDLIRAFQQDGLSELGVPKQILHMKAIPLLGTGKTDYVSAKQYALDQLSQV